MPEQYSRVKDFTYYPLMSRTQCAFKVASNDKIPTYRPCKRNRQEIIEGYSFCPKHTAQIRRMAEAGKIGCAKCNGHGWYLEQFSDSHRTTCTECGGNGKAPIASLSAPTAEGVRP